MKVTEIKLGKYKHFKGMVVEVIGIAFHSETMEEMVMYIHPNPIKGKDANTMWVRPKKCFWRKSFLRGKRFLGLHISNRGK